MPKVRQGTSGLILVGPFQNADGTYPNGPLEAAACQLSINGAALAPKHDTADGVATHNGCYSVAFDAEDTARTGYAVLIATLSTGMSRRVDFDVVP